jgi:hypothetical protein
MLSENPAGVHVESEGMELAGVHLDATTVARTSVRSKLPREHGPGGLWAEGAFLRGCGLKSAFQPVPTWTGGGNRLLRLRKP